MSERHDKSGNIHATSVSWMDNLTTKRIYEIDGKDVIILNEYQKISCVHCGKPIFGRLTSIYTSKNNLREIHINYNKSLQKLRNLLITYFPIKETKIAGKYCLVCKNKIIRTEKMVTHRLKK